MESVVNFGNEKKTSEDADVSPSIIVARNPPAAPKPKTARLCTIPREQLHVEDLSRQINAEGVELPLEQLGTDTWQLEPGGVTKLTARIREACVVLSELAVVEP